MPLLLLALLGVTGAATAPAGDAAPTAGYAVRTPPTRPDDPLFSAQWGLRDVQAPAAWSAGDGRRVTIAVVDTGVDPSHPDLAGKVLAGINLVRPGTPPTDGNGHGTAVAGVAAADTDNGVGIAGVAPGADILPVKALDAAGDGSVTVVAAGIAWAVDHGAAVINLSLSNLVPGPLPPALRSAIDAAWRRGAVCVLAAGNDPATQAPRIDDAVVVTAVGPDLRLADYASPVGPDTLALSAPGGTGAGTAQTDIASTYWTPGAGATYAYLSGTSMAAAFVSGALADLISAGLRPHAAARQLVASATAIGPRAVYGAGLVDVTRAVAETVAARRVRVLPARRSVAPPSAPTSTPPRQRPLAAGPVPAGSPAGHAALATLAALALAAVGLATLRLALPGAGAPARSSRRRSRHGRSRGGRQP